MAKRGRNYPQGLAETPSGDAQLLQVIGQVSADAFAQIAMLAVLTGLLSMSG